MFSIGDVTYPHIDQNGISGKSTKNGLTSPKHNFFGNGRTKLVYDSFWQQGPPKLQKNWFGEVSPTYPTSPDRFAIFLGFFGNFEVGRRSSKNRVLGLPSPKKMFENWFFQNVLKFSKNMILKLHFGMFTSGILLITRAREFFEILIDSFSR